MEKKGISAIIYDNNGDYYFLVLHRVLDWEGWEFVKGEAEEGEEWSDTMLRVVVKETGLSKFRVHKKIEMAYEFDASDGKRIYDVYLVETSMNIPVNIKKNDEHDNYIWTSFNSVMEKLVWPEQKKVFEAAFEEIKKIK